MPLSYKAIGWGHLKSLVYKKGSPPSSQKKKGSLIALLIKEESDWLKVV